jgi:hypothetical protein
MAAIGNSKTKPVDGVLAQACVAMADLRRDGDGILSRRGPAPDSGTGIA